MAMFRRWRVRIDCLYYSPFTNSLLGPILVIQKLGTYLIFLRPVRLFTTSLSDLTVASAFMIFRISERLLEHTNGQKKMRS